MGANFRYITTEQISKYHPDKYADQISDKITTYLIRQNPFAKVAVETLVKDKIVVVAGEISGAELDTENLHRLVYEVADSLGYEVNEIYNFIGEQSLEIKNAVEQEELGAGDQGIMFGYATRETNTYLPLGVDLANKIIGLIEQTINFTKLDDGTFVFHSLYRGDAKTQVTIDTLTNEVETVLISVCYNKDRLHNQDIHLEEVRELTKQYIMDSLYDDYGIDLSGVEFIVNPAGAWHLGGPHADSGLTGRKIVADQYGAYVPVGGGAFSGKDLTKVDRSAAYMAREVAVNYLKENEELNWVKVHVGYAIGKPYPVSLSILSDKGLLTYNDEIRELFKVSNLVEYFKGLDLYELSKGCHFRYDLRPNNG